MTERDPLQAFFEAGDVPATDPGFRLSVMEAVAARRFRLELAVRLAAGVVLLVLAVALAPVAGDIVRSFAPLLDDTVAVVALAIAVVAALGGQLWLMRGAGLSWLRLS
jgi:hypothetical protein